MILAACTEPLISSRSLFDRDKRELLAVDVHAKNRASSREVISFPGLLSVL
jgi:hypothetical protein